MEKQVYAVGYAHTPGRHRIKRDMERFYNRFFVWLMFRDRVPVRLRDELLERVIEAGRWAFGSRWSVIAGASKGDTFENDGLKLWFNATAIANIADNAATSPLTDIQMGLHTADPGETGTQTTSEAAYTSYARVAVARTTGGWTVTANSVSPVANISFPQATGGSETITHFHCGTASSGAGKILYSGTVTPNISVSNGVTPILTTATTITED